MLIKNIYLFTLCRNPLAVNPLTESVSCSVVSDSATPWTVTYQAAPSMGFSKQEYWSGLPFLFPGDLPDPRIEPRSPTLQGRFFTI